MADKKISQLTAATIPLAGTEPVPLVQSGNTVKATAQNIANLAIPSQASQSGKFLTTNGTAASWGAVSQVPSQTGQGGKFLTTNGTTASWAAVSSAWQIGFVVVGCIGGTASVFQFQNAYGITYTASINGGNIWLTPSDVNYTLKAVVCSNTNTDTFSATLFPIALSFDGSQIAKIAVRNTNGAASDMSTTDITFFYVQLYYDGF
jgi:hypothetical protein